MGALRLANPHPPIKSAVMKQLAQLMITERALLFQPWHCKISEMHPRRVDGSGVPRVCITPDFAIRTVLFFLRKRCPEVTELWVHVRVILAHLQRSGAVGACEAHNLEVVRSKLTFATWAMRSIDFLAFLLPKHQMDSE